MSDWERLSKQAERIKEAYPPGTRVLLIDMNDPFAPVPSGTRGTVDWVDDIGQLHMKWDNGRTLAIVPGEDSFRKLTAAELSEENKETQNLSRVDDLIAKATNIEQDPFKGIPKENSKKTFKESGNKINNRNDR